jgi:predicted amidohydrolase YtcJ
MLPTHPCLADLLVVGAQVLTMHAAQPEAEAVVVGDGRVTFVGKEADARALPCVGPSTREVRLGGGAVLPGFVDTHAHPADGGLKLGFAQLSGVTDEAGLLAAVGAWADAHPDAAWIEGAGWSPTLFDGARPIAALDALSPRQPVFLASVDGHSAFVNTAALRRAHLLRGEAPAGGRVEVDERGKPTGVLRETAADAVAEAIPEPDAAAIETAALAALRDFVAHGVTRVVDANASRATLRAYRRLDRAGRLPIPVHAAVEVTPGEGAAGVRRVAALARRFAGARLRVDAVKLYLDGVMESGTAAMREPYTDGKNGDLLFGNVELAAIVRAADRAGLQVHVHAIGDGAVHQLLDAVEAAGPRPAGRPVLVAHIEAVDPADLPRFAPLGVWPNLQAVWACRDAWVDQLTVPRVGEARAARLYPFGSLVRVGATVVGGSDWSVTTLNPWPAIEVGVTRRDPDGVAGSELNPAEALDLDTMLRAYTSQASAALGHGEAGVLRPGAPADFVVLDHDPRTRPASMLGDIVVLQTWVEGQLVWARDLPVD